MLSPNPHPPFRERRPTIEDTCRRSARGPVEPSPAPAKLSRVTSATGNALPLVERRRSARPPSAAATGPWAGPVPVETRPSTGRHAPLQTSCHAARNSASGPSWRPSNRASRSRNRWLADADPPPPTRWNISAWPPRRSPADSPVPLWLRGPYTMRIPLGVCVGLGAWWNYPTQNRRVESARRFPCGKTFHGLASPPNSPVMCLERSRKS